MKQRKALYASVVAASIFCCGGSCQEYQEVGEGPDAELIASWAQREVSRAQELAMRFANTAERARLETLQGAIVGYVDSVAASIQAFRADVSSLAEERHNVEGTVEALRLAGQATEHLVQVAPWALVEQSDVLVFGARYLDLLAEAASAAENDEPQDDPSAFLLRYTSAVDAHNRWAQSVSAWLEVIGEDPVTALSIRAEQEIRAHLVLSCERGLSAELVGACRDWMRRDEVDGPTSYTFTYYRRLAALLTDDLNLTSDSSAHDCTTATIAVIVAVDECLTSTVAPGGDESESLLEGIEERERSRSDSCPDGS